MLNSKTLNYFIKIFSFLPKSRRKEFFALIPIALISGVSEIFVLAIVSRLFNFLSNQPRDSVPF
jgi:ATP-binding cassette subfamily B protein